MGILNFGLRTKTTAVFRCSALKWVAIVLSAFYFEHNFVLIIYDGSNIKIRKFFTKGQNIIFYFLKLSVSSGMVINYIENITENIIFILHT